MSETANADPLERLEEIKSQVPRAIGGRELGSALDAAVQAVKGADQSISRLGELAEFMPLVRDHLDDLGKDGARGQLANLRGIAQRLENAFDVETLSAATQAVTHQLEPAVVQTDQFVTRGWKEKVEHAFAPTGRLGGVLRQIPETETLGAGMETVFQRAGHLIASVTDATESAEQYSALIAERDHVNKKLDSFGAGEVVVDFLLAVAEQRASLKHVTDHV